MGALTNFSRKFNPRRSPGTLDLPPPCPIQLHGRGILADLMQWSQWSRPVVFTELCIACCEWSLMEGLTVWPALPPARSTSISTCSITAMVRHEHCCVLNKAPVASVTSAPYRWRNCFLAGFTTPLCRFVGFLDTTRLTKDDILFVVGSAFEDHWIVRCLQHAEIAPLSLSTKNAHAFKLHTQCP